MRFLQRGVLTGPTAPNHRWMEADTLSPTAQRPRSLHDRLIALQRRVFKMAELAQIGVTGLAVMGRNLARNFARHGHRVAIHNRTYAKTEALIAEAGSEGTFLPSQSMA